MPLVDTGLVCRYYIDEAASGTTPTTIEDASSNAYDLTEVNYGSGNMAYAEPSSGHRGLDSGAVTGGQRARRGIDNTSDAVRDVDGGTAYTIEVVMHLDTGNANGGRIFGINDRVGGNGDLVLKANSATLKTLQFGFNEANFQLPTPLPDEAVHVVHIVIDTTQATQADRLRFAYDGGTLTQVTNTILQNAVLAIDTSSDLICLNRESSGNFDRSINGAVYYAALYEGALSQTDIETNADVLAANDDNPGGGATTEEGDISSSGESANTLAGASLAAVPISASGDALQTMAGASTAASPISMAGEAAFTMSGAAIAEAPVSAAGESANTFEGEATAQGAGDVLSEGVSTMDMEGSSIAAADVDGAGEALGAFRGSSTSTAARRGALTRRKKRDRFEEIRLDDEEVLLALHKALPHATIRDRTVH